MKSSSSLSCSRFVTIRRLRRLQQLPSNSSLLVFTNHEFHNLDGLRQAETEPFITLTQDRTKSSTSLLNLQLALLPYSMGAISLLLSTATSNPQYGATSISLAAFQPALTAVISSSPTPFSASGFLATATSIIAVSATSVATAGPESGPDTDNGECQLLGPFAILIQAALGALALLSLVFKRWRERPQRPLKIWGFDVSKQVVGSILLHLANLLMSMLSSGQLTVSPTTSGEYTANPCSFYLLNLGIDVSPSILINYSFNPD